MKVGSDLPATEHDNIVRQKHIQLIHKVLQILYRFAFEMCVEIARIDACVGAAASGNRNLLFQFQADAFFEHLLHGDIARLYLPTVVSFSVIRQM